MANRCFSEFALQPIDPKNEEHWKQLNDFISVLCSFREKLKEQKKAHVLLYLDQLWGEAFQMPLNIKVHTRGTFVFGCRNSSLLTAEECFEQAKKDSYFLVSVDSAWGPPVDFFEILLEKKYPHLKMDLFSEEPNSDIFINTNWKIWKTKYRVIDYEEDEEQFLNSDQELIDMVNARLKIAGLPSSDSVKAAIYMAEKNFDMFVNEYDESWD